MASHNYINKIIDSTKRPAVIGLTELLVSPINSEARVILQPRHVSHCVGLHFTWVP